MTKPIKLFFVITRLDRGGSAEVVLQLSRAFQESSFSVGIVHGQTAEPQEKLDQFQKSSGIPLYFVPHLRREMHPVHDLLALFDLIRLFRQHRPTLLHTHTSKAGFLGRMAGLLAGVPIRVHTPHGHVFYGYFGPLRSRLIIWLERFAAHFTDRIITLTEVGKKDHVRFRIAPEEKFLPIYCGIDLSRFSIKRSEETRRLKKTLQMGEGPVIGSVGRLVPVKGYEYFIHACALVQKTNPEAQFLLVGDGPLKQSLHALAKRLSLEETLFFTGFRKDIASLLLLMDIFVLSSLNEGLGRVLMEAGAVGLPVVATHVGGVPEIVVHRKTGLLVPPRDPERMASAVRMLLTDVSLRKKMGEEAKKRTREHYRVETMVEKTKALYESLLETSK